MLVSKFQWRMRILWGFSLKSFSAFLSGFTWAWWAWPLPLSLVVFPSPVTSRDDFVRTALTWARDSETRRLDRAERLTCVRDGVTRRVREAAFFIFHRPPRFARVHPHLSQVNPSPPTPPPLPCRYRTWITDNPKFRRPREKERQRGIPYSVLGARCERSRRSCSDFGGERWSPLDEKKKYLVSACTPWATLF